MPGDNVNIYMYPVTSGTAEVALFHVSVTSVHKLIVGALIYVYVWFSM